MLLKKTTLFSHWQLFGNIDMHFPYFINFTEAKNLIFK